MDPSGQFRIRLAARQLARGGVVAYPTEAVFGLGCDPYRGDAVERIFALKGRSARKGLIVVGATVSHLRPFAQLDSPAVARAIRKYWPGPTPTTLVVPGRDETPPWLTGQHATVAVRLTEHPIAAALCRAFGGAVVSTSANRSGQPPLRDGWRVRLRFRDGVDAVIPGPVDRSQGPTRLVDALSGEVIRA